MAKCNLVLITFCRDGCLFLEPANKAERSLTWLVSVVLCLLNHCMESLVCDLSILDSDYCSVFFFFATVYKFKLCRKKKSESSYLHSTSQKHSFTVVI